MSEVFLDSQVDVVRQGLKDALLKGCLDNVLKVITGLHAAVDESRPVVLQEEVMHGCDKVPNLGKRERERGED